jgi:hypothetical protein
MSFLSRSSSLRHQRQENAMAMQFSDAANWGLVFRKPTQRMMGNYDRAVVDFILSAVAVRDQIQPDLKGFRPCNRFREEKAILRASRGAEGQPGSS